MSELIHPFEIARNTYWVGKRDPKSIFHANPYLRVFRGEAPDGRVQQFNLLIDPGSRSDYAVVSTKVGALIGNMSRLTALWVNHQDPDVGSSAGLIIGRNAPKASVICSEATWRLISHYGIPRERFFATDKVKTGLQFFPGAKVIPVPSPFCHFRGAVMCYDPETRVLFTGDLFGGLTDMNATGLWADESDWRGLRAFHQAYMPSNKAIAATIEAIRALTPKVEILAPQHGRVIRGDLVQRFMDKLQRLPVGLDIVDTEECNAEILNCWNSVLSRVLETARVYLGTNAEERLAACADLEDVLTFEKNGPRVTGMPRWALGIAVGALTAHEPPSIATVIKQEAIIAADELQLPAPDLPIEDVEPVDPADLQ